MLPGEREIVILNLLEHNAIVTVAQICSQCNCSPQTARRDLARLEARRLLRRTHGGAVRVSSSSSVMAKPSPDGVLEARTALVDRADVLIVTPSETAITRLLVERARRAGIPIVAESQPLSGAATVIAVDDYEAGLELGRWLVAYARSHLEGRVVVLDVSSARPGADARSRGFAEGLRELPPGMRTMYRLNGGSLAATARRAAADALAVHPEINVIFGSDDDSALGALAAYRAAGLDESGLVVVSVGCAGTQVRSLLAQDGPFKASVALFPELAARVCIDAAVCAYHGHGLPERLTLPFTIVTAATLEDYYTPAQHDGEWTLDEQRSRQLINTAPGLSHLDGCPQRAGLQTIGYVQILSSHQWYQALRRGMLAYARARSAQLEVVDASQDLAREIDGIRRRISATAARLVSDSDVLILDAGATTAYLAAALRGRQGLTVITNSLQVMAELQDEKGITVVASGGVVRAESHALVGTGAEETFHALRADKAFLECSGFSTEFGLSGTSIAEAGVKQAMIRAAREVIVLADYTRIGSESLVKVAPFSSVHTLITDSGISAFDRRRITEGGVSIVIAEDYQRFL